MYDDSSSRIAAELRSWISTAPPGAKLPSTRSLVERHAASPVTVQKALRTLATAGLVESRPGVGTFVRTVRTARPNDYGWQTGALATPGHRMPKMPAALQSAPNDVIALHSGYPDRELLPERLVRAAFARAARSDAVINRPPAAGLGELQAWFATELGSAVPLGVTPPAPGDVVVQPGSQAGLSTVFRTLVGIGRPLLVESPTYWGAILAAEQAGVEVIPVPSGFSGPDPDELARAFERTGARVFYAQPNFASPTGAQWSDALREQVLGIVREHSAFLIEDDAMHDFGITADSTPLAARDDAGHVVYIRSLAKSVSPAVRVGAVIARGPAHERILADTQVHSMYVSGILQAVALDVVTHPSWKTHLRNLRHQLQSRRDLLVDSLREYAPLVHIEAVPRGGINLWVQLPDAVDMDLVVQESRSAGVIIGAGSDWFPAEATGKYLRLTYAGPNPGTFPDAARALGEIIARC
ncbi:MAG: PLP-dependent aminotransferase family protein [Rhodococcus sp. (in: high G+C Gram-positive bacteria)]